MELNESHDYNSLTYFIICSISQRTYIPWYNLNVDLDEKNVIKTEIGLQL